MEWFDPDQEHTDSVPFDRFDLALWEEAREQSERLDSFVRDLQMKYDYAEDLTQDVFNILAKGYPTLRSPQEMKITHLVNRQMAEDLASLPELGQLRDYTVADGFCSAAGLMSLESVIKDALERAKSLRERADQAAAAQEAANEAGRLAEEDPSDENQQATTQAQQEAQQQADGLQQQAEAESAAARSKMRKEIKKAAEEQQEAQETAAAYGTSPGDLQRMNFADRMALAKRLNNPKLKRFAALVGAFAQLESAEMRRNSVDGSDEVVGVEFGNDLTRLTTQDLLNLAAPETEDDFWLRYAEGNLLIKKLRGRQREGRGPIIVCADESGSMAGGGEMWAKGLALALLNRASRQGRDFHYVGFDTRIRTFSFPGGKPRRDDVLDMVEGFLSGGTSFEEPLRFALDEVKKSDRARPDVVFITDGQAPIPRFIDDWKATMKRLSAKCFGIYVSSYEGFPSALTEITDDVRTVHDLLDVQQARDIMRQS